MFRLSAEITGESQNDQCKHKCDRDFGHCNAPCPKVYSPADGVASVRHVSGRIGGRLCITIEMENHEHAEHDARKTKIVIPRQRLFENEPGKNAEDGERDRFLDDLQLGRL